MRKLLLLGLLFGAWRPAAGEIIDRIVAVVGRDIVTQSDIDKESRLEAFFQRESREPVLERLIRQRLMQQEMKQATFPATEEAQIKEWLARERPPGAVPARYGLTEADLEDYARRQLDILRFIDLRFKPGVQIPPAEVGEYYQKTLLPELKRRGMAEIPTLEAAQPQIEQVLVEERVNQLLDQWLEEARTRLGVRLMETGKP